MFMCVEQHSTGITDVNLACPWSVPPGSHLGQGGQSVCRESTIHLQDML